VFLCFVKECDNFLTKESTLILRVELESGLELGLKIGLRLGVGLVLAFLFLPRLLDFLTSVYDYCSYSLKVTRDLKKHWRPLIIFFFLPSSLSSYLRTFSSIFFTSRSCSSFSFVFFLILFSPVSGDGQLIFKVRKVRQNI